MPFDSFVTAAVARELVDAILGGSVLKIYQPAPTDLHIHVRAGGQKHVLLISAHAELYGICLASRVPPNPPAPPRFCASLRKHIEGARVQSLQQIGFDRIVRIGFRRSDGVRVMVAELMGKHSNICLLDEDETIIDCIKPIGTSVNRHRQLLPNRPYVPPPSSSKPHSLALTQDEIVALLGAPPIAPDRIVATLAGISPFMAREVLARANTADPHSVAAALTSLLDCVRQGAFSPTMLLDPTDTPVDCWAAPILHVPNARTAPFPSMSLAIEAVRSRRLLSEGLEAARRQLSSRLRQELARLDWRRQAALAALDDAAHAEEYRTAGELLMANLHSVNRGDEAVELPNYYDPGQRPLRISLDPTLSPQENAASYFRRYRKAKSGEDALQKQMAELEQKRESAHVLLTRVEAAQSMQEVELLRPEVERLAPLRAPHEAPAAHRGLRTAPPPKIQRIQAEGGWEILVGETKEANDYLTTKIASPDDLWFHVRAAASAHVVVRTGRRPQQVPREVIMQAARLAAAHSEAKHSSVVAVDYTLKRYVHKPRGSAPGAVIYRNEKTVHVEP